jgi:hypothetical protein
MKKTLLAMTALAGLAAAMPAAAQYQGRYPSQYDQSRYPSQYGQDISFDARIDALQTRLDAGLRAGTITRREAWPLRRQLDGLRQLEARYSLNGFTRFERDDLQQRLRGLRQDLRVADNGGYDRYDRMAWDDTGYGRSANNYGQGGPYEEVVCQRRSGVGGFIDTLTGSQNCYAVGDRVGNGLYAVPYDYQSRYRDSGSVYYRSDGRSIYEIDARTNTVIRAYPMNR